MRDRTQGDQLTRVGLWLVTILCSFTLVVCGAGTAQQDSVSQPSRDEAALGNFEGLDGFLEQSQAEAILARTERVTLRASTEGLTEGEELALAELLALGEIFQRLYEDSCHPEAGVVREYLNSYVPNAPGEAAELERLRDLYWIFRGPVVTTLDNQRVPLAPIESGGPGRNLYPEDLEADELRRYGRAHPEAGVFEVRSVLRRRSAAALEADRRALEVHPVLATLHPELVERLAAGPNEQAYYSVPYAVAYAEQMLEGQRRLQRAADLVRSDDEDLADYFEQRGRDLLTNDYEAGDACWVSGRPRRLNAQIGAYETYDDNLLGIRAFFSLSILIRDQAASRELERAVEHLPALQRALPGSPTGRVRALIPIGIYDVYADFGQARGTNTASILPNEAHIVRRYGRTIIIRRNVLLNPTILDISQRRFRAVVASEHAEELGPRGNFDRTVFHEVGHYLGYQETEDGRPVSEALGSWHNHLEELKADLISLWLSPRLVELGVIDEERARSMRAAGVLRIAPPVEPRRDQPYQTMQLMQQRYFLDQGVLSFDGETGRFSVDHERYIDVVEQMLREVLDIQRRGDPAAAEAFIERWAVWDDAVQGVIGRAVDAAAPRFRLVRYSALEGGPSTGAEAE